MRLIDKLRSSEEKLNAQGWEARSFSAGEVLFAKGDPADMYFILDRGRVAIVANGMGEEREDGAVLGDCVFFPGERRAGDAVAREDSLVYALPRARMLALRASDEETYDWLTDQALRESWLKLEQKDRELIEHVQASAPNAKAPDALAQLWSRFKGESAPPADVDAVLARLPVVEWATDETRRQLSEAMTAQFVPANHALYMQGDASSRVFVVASGDLAVMREELGQTARELTVLSGGSLLGAGGFIAGEPRNASAVAKTDTWVLGISREEAAGMPATARRTLHEALLTTMRVQLRAANMLTASLQKQQSFDAMLGAFGQLEGWRAGDPLTEVRYENLVPAIAPEPVDEEFKTLATLVRGSVIGKDEALRTPFGTRRLVYADYTASGRSLSFIEDFIRERVMTLYANTHTEASASGLQTTRFREEARELVARCVGATDNDEVIFIGSGATGAINRLVDILQLRQPLAGDRDIPPEECPVVFIGPYEHHSNILPWRHSIADVVEIAIDDAGGVDLDDLTAQLKRYAKRPLRIGSFSAASNVTGVATDVVRVTKLLHEHGALSFWDYAAAGPYVPIDMNPEEAGASMDAIFLSPHKFVGGPGTPGLLVIKKKLVAHGVPTQPGGGTVDFVTASDSIYSDRIADREEAGTPAILESIRCGLVFQLKDQVGAHRIHEMEQRFVKAAIKSWSANRAISVLGPIDRERLSIVSFLVRHGRGFLHYNFVVALLNDLFGIQARGGCSCAGPYGARLFGMSEQSSDAFLDLSQRGMSSSKPGWTRVNFNYFISPREFRYIVEAVQLVAIYGYALMPSYTLNIESGLWTHKGGNPYRPTSLSDLSVTGGEASWPATSQQRSEDALDEQLEDGRRILQAAALSVPDEIKADALDAKFERYRWFPLPHEEAAWMRYTNGDDTQRSRGD